MIDGARMVEVGLKSLLWMVAGFFLMVIVSCVIGFFGAVKDAVTDRTRREVLQYIVMAIISSVLMMIFSGLALMPWWS